MRGARQRGARLRQTAGLVGGHRRRRTRTTGAEPTPVPAPQRGARTCSAPRAGWLALAVRLAAHARRGVGWALAAHRRTDRARAALPLARRARCPSVGLVHHTGRGGQDTAAAYRGTLAAHGVTGSRSRSGACLDNAMAARCFATRTAEVAATQHGPSRGAARRASCAWLAVWYHRQRRHSALAYQPPVTAAARLGLHEQAA